MEINFQSACNSLRIDVQLKFQHNLNFAWHVFELAIEFEYHFVLLYQQSSTLD